MLFDSPDRRQLPRRDNSVWTQEQREKYRQRLMIPGPVMMWKSDSDPWQGVR